MRKNWVKIVVLCMTVMAVLLTSSPMVANAQEQTKGTIIMATTTSFRDSGLADVLIKEMEKVSGYKINLVAQGSGAAIQMLLRGDAQIGITHAPDSEVQLLEAGWIRMPIMTNYFYLVGPKNDPAGVKGKTLTQAFKVIYDKQYPFVTRNDNSGTDVKEKNIWKSLGLDANTFGSWYIKTQAGMLNSLQIANEKGAYILTDQSTWIKNKGQLTNLDFITTSGEGLNIYSFFFKDPQYKVLADYLKTPEAQAFMRQYYFDPITENTPITTPALTASTVQLAIGFKVMPINGLGATGKPYQLDAPPYIKNGRTMVPIRAVTEPFGAKVDWDGATRTVIISFQGHTVKMTIGSNVATVDGARVTMDVAPEIINSRTFVPARFVSESLGFTVRWNDKTKTVTITYP
ncbi:anion ABC transporter anion-binding protein [Coprothermobacter proteolyticus DSM 5265]|uniref:Anion ABC transporter, anion-binding protein n=1 Tax=Coprothermobacter proteolyticus (strain ATCC 35245 / DSM 5265 / OCM 4 / BT) TaxID=309798 RepID=B5Y6Q0_COPPD|nr:stalk domain-containing protein [Coprothermobacter proteolyticus]ACI18144.1 anion ABC transporter anion-binding protein [Coprothermobacter proteolyticus DSM 5265]